MSQFTGPRNCAECGAEFTPEIILAGGSAPATVEVRGHHVMVPGLWRCQGCDQAIDMGARTSVVTIQNAVEFLNDTAGPMLAMAMLEASSDDEFVQITGRLREVIEVHTALEAVLVLMDEPGGLDFIPVCDGHHGDHAHDHLPNGQDRSKIGQN